MSERLLASSHRSSQPYPSEDNLHRSLEKPRRGLKYFLTHNATISFSFLAGFTCVVVVIAFTQWLSKQVPRCPDWSIDCEIPRRVQILTANLGTLQGIVTAVYSIGLAAMAFAAHGFSESAIWPLLGYRRLTFKQIELYIEASRGSIPSSPLTLLAARNLDSVLVALSTIVITLTPLCAAPIVGKVYNKRDVSIEFQSQAFPGGGIGPQYFQTYPPFSLRDSPVAFYNSWVYDLAVEPMPERREWFLDRSSLSARGNFSVKTVKLEQNITCRGWNATSCGFEGSLLCFPTHTPDSDKKYNRTAYNYGHKVAVRDIPRLAVWAHNYTFHASNKTTTTLIFAALNGHIEGGTTTTPPPNATITNLTSIACEVTVGFFEDTLTIGDKFQDSVQINSIDQLAKPGWSGDINALNELALWFTVAPVANGASVYGSQPMYQYRTDGLPERFTTTLSDNEIKNFTGNDWLVEDIKSLIRVSTGASILGEVTKWPKDPVTFSSRVFISKMDPDRPVLLIVLPAIITVAGALLVVWNLKMHKEMLIPIMRKATLSEVLKSSQTKDILEVAAVEKVHATEPSRLNEMKVKFMRSDDGVWGLYDPKASLELGHRMRRRPTEERPGAF